MQAGLATTIGLLFLTVCSCPHAGRPVTQAPAAAAQGAHVVKDDEKFVKETYVYRTVPRGKLQADVYRVRDGTPQPVVMWIHGGALIFGHREGIAPHEVAMFLGAGYTVVSIDYRLAPEAKLRGIIEDVQDAYRWVRTSGPELFGADADRVAVMGGSAGGYLTLLAGACFEPRPSALVSVAGYCDITGPWYSSPDAFYRQQPIVPKQKAYEAVGGQEAAWNETQGSERWSFYLYCRQQGLWPREVAGYDPHTEPEAFDPYCPVRNITADYPPTLLVHGDKDTDVPYEQSALMAQSLARAGVEHEFISIAGGGHCSMGLDEAFVAKTYARILAFLDRHLSPRQR